MSTMKRQQKSQCRCVSRAESRNLERSGFRGRTIPPPRTALLILLLVSTTAVADDSPREAESPAQEFEALVAEYEEVGGAEEYAPRFFELEEKHRHDPAGVSALVWVLKRRRTKPEAIQAIELLEAHHLESGELGAACVTLARVPSTTGERLLRAILEESPHEDVRAQASYYLAYLLEDQLRIVSEFNRQPELADRMLQYYGQEYGAHLAALVTMRLEEQLEAVYEQMADSFADVAIDDATMGEIAEGALFRIRNLAIGQVAPEIEGEDIHGESFKLSDYRGNVVMLTFWGHW